MARAHRFAALTLVLSALYLLALFQVVPVPFVEKKIASEILPFVRQQHLSVHTTAFSL